MEKESIKQYKNVKQLKSTSARKNAITLGKMFYNDKAMFRNFNDKN